ncbi:SDH family Clp fold serine proteinase [Acinetobacter guillouiae]|uniref:SDH family Clp fold serine proteinase n=1 Tax=Acinetobacter guillouiae TaxID=106649 RepID=UPI00124F9AF1|nr:ATP-dependent Clp protease proteolytic subunit [Acinetobacter guillouiae]
MKNDENTVLAPPDLEFTSSTKETSKKYDLYNFSDLWDLISENRDEINLIKTNVGLHIKNLQKKFKVDQYELVIIFDEKNSINTFHSDQVYNAISNLNKEKDILMFLLSDGGTIEPAYLISKTCKRLCKEKFVVTVPRRAKSAATLIALGANEIHMGLLSELGPIDPQINGLPALGLTNALEKIASLAHEFPKSSDMFSKYLTENLKMNELGYFERINESAVQYAQRLLDGKKFANNETAQSLANHFTNHYKDHSFVIDSEEALKYLGNHIIKEGTYEYEFGNELFTLLNFISFIFEISLKKEFSFVGSTMHGIHTKNK